MRFFKHSLNNASLLVLAALSSSPASLLQAQNFGDNTDYANNESDNVYDEITIAMPSGHAPVMVITSTRHSKDEALINDFVSLEEMASAPTSITDLLQLEQGLAANGQPGLFQTLNIRGLARQRVHAYVNGMRITSERRAGVAASFIDPLLLSGAEVTQGPASTYYGSGAIAGTIHLITRQDDNFWFSGGYKTDGNEWVTALGNGGDSYSFGLAMRERSNGETIEGEEKNNHFSQTSLNYLQQFEVEDYKLDWQLLYSRGDDIGKDNTRFPTSRITSYPEEEHLLSQISLSSSEDWQARFYFHEQTLVTQDVRPGNRINRVTTDSLDLGLSLENSWLFQDFSGQYGIDYFGRRGVESLETEVDIPTQQSQSFAGLEDGEENETALFVTANRDFDYWRFSSGLRANYQSQQSATSNKVSDDYFTYFVTAIKPVGLVDISLSYGTGFRFASLSERLFNGTTARGQTLGNPDLKPEESASLDLGIEYKSDQWTAEYHYFRTDVDNFIERISIDEDTKSFSNLTNGELTGWQYRLSYAMSSQLKIELSGQEISGEDQQGNSLADIPPKRHTISVSYENGNWFARMSLAHRLDKSSTGDGEIAIEGADIANARLGYQISEQWNFDVYVENLLDEEFFNSADDLGTLAAGREFGVSFSYRQ